MIKVDDRHEIGFLGAGGFFAADEPVIQRSASRKSQVVRVSLTPNYR